MSVKSEIIIRGMNECTHFQTQSYLLFHTESGPNDHRKPHRTVDLTPFFWETYWGGGTILECIIWSLVEPDKNITIGFEMNHIRL